MVPTSTPKNQKMKIPGPGSKVSTQFAVGVRFSSLNTVSGTVLEFVKCELSTHTQTDTQTLGLVELRLRS